jgi:ribonuclease P protein component
VSEIRPTGRFSSDRRLRKRREFQRVQASGRRVTTPHFLLFLALADATKASPARLGITASRRIGGAVIRNRAKRLVREAFRATQELWAAGVEVVVVVRCSLGRMKVAEIVAEWRAAERAIRRRTVEARRDRGQSPLAQGH